MGIVELMDNLKKALDRALLTYDPVHPGLVVNVYAGYPPIPTDAKARPSNLYALVTEFTDDNAEDFSTAKVEIGFSIYDDDVNGGGRELFGLMEHVRRYLLGHPRIGGGRNALELPLKGSIPDSQPFPQWQGKLEATYTIYQPEEGYKSNVLDEDRNDVINPMFEP